MTRFEELSAAAKPGQAIPVFQKRDDHSQRVWALKIGEIVLADPQPDDVTQTGAMVACHRSDWHDLWATYAPFPVTLNYLEMQKPEVGGYYVITKDGEFGDASFVPGDTFEAAYSRVR